ncbi:MFS transporter [Ruania suaedae]|uniref:MFS transporter n=1 Tax=Ruania suaedae TaxID=2897774 RepID=UPI001E3282E5|nr:MFS transporter [Ruania suaedae]UFU03618.1 MFS transporter [Ruania suaedae]
MNRMFASLRLYNYRLWFAGALVANVGTWMQRIAQDWLVLTELSDDSGTAVGIVTGLQFVPSVLLTPYAGVLADRLDKRTLLLVTQGAMGVLAAALGALVLSGQAELWHVYVFALLLGIASAFDVPARQTFVAELVPVDGLPNAVALNSASFNAARMIGPGVAGLLIAVVGPGWVFLINAASFAATIVAMLAMRASDLRRVPRTPRARGQLRAGFAYVRHRSDIVLIMIVVFVVGGIGLNFQLTSAVMARVEFGRDAGEYGILGSILAVGSLAGALMAARRRRPRVRMVILAAFGYAASATLLALAPTYELFALACIPAGFCSLTMLTSANAAIQISTDPAFRGRVMSLYVVVLFAGNPIGSPLVGWIADAWGPRWSIGVGAIAAFVVAAAAAVWASRSWDVEVRYRIGARPRLQLTNAGERAAAESMSVSATERTGESADQATDESTDEDGAEPSPEQPPPDRTAAPRSRWPRRRSARLGPYRP